MLTILSFQKKGKITLGTRQSKPTIRLCEGTKQSLSLNPISDFGKCGSSFLAMTSLSLKKSFITENLFNNIKI